ncbi:S8 family serine peptidase [Roseivirga sp. E12]|uniref:S8 family serine peptidase n=1 Tax=Roseivirga sp. E12 TaxID=2819237 RepID=UPI001ABBE471|nr:S8 family serine peptidase [Roseivirga sp. E12]MBO3697356.1 S8 family serine peptidase [Roseivirga sp. E12]
MSKQDYYKGTPIKGKALDPGLQEIELRLKHNLPLKPETLSVESSKEKRFIRVILKIDAKAESLPAYFKRIVQIGDILTGVIPDKKISDLRQHPAVISLKATRRIHANLHYSVRKSKAGKIDISHFSDHLKQDLDGSGVVVGVIDSWIDFAHSNFLNSDGTTRIKRLWDQFGGRNLKSPSPYNYGREFKETEINEALNTDDPYLELAYDPRTQSQTSDIEHGTHVTDIAAGNGKIGSPGVAPNADIVFVDVNTYDYREDLGTFGNSANLLEAVDYIFQYADKHCKKAVINISMGTYGGPHDGTTLVEQAFDHYLSYSKDKAIIISAGNSRELGVHASGLVSSAESKTLQWEINSDDKTENEIEIWYGNGYSDQALTVSLVDPNGTKTKKVKLGKNLLFSLEGELVGRIIHREKDPNNGANLVNIILYHDKPELPKGLWQVLLENTANKNIGYHAWIERDNWFHQSAFSRQDQDERCTLGSIATGEQTIVVGSYLSGVAATPSNFTSEGPTRVGSNKPEISAPGEFLNNSGIKAAQATTQGLVKMSGTSMAAPHVAGAVAVLMQASNNSLTNQEIRNLLFDQNSDWNGQLGYQMLNLQDSLNQLYPNIKIEEGAKRSDERAGNTDWSRGPSRINAIRDSIDWTPINDSTISPWRALCRLVMTIKGKTYYGSGCLIGPQTVLTAAHNVYLEEQASYVKVYAGYDPKKGNAVGESGVKDMKYPQEWTLKKTPLKYDFAMLTLDKPLGKEIGYFGYAMIPNASKLEEFKFNLAGYPFYGDLAGDQLVFTSGNINTVEESHFNYRLDTEKGMSGGPVFVSNREGNHYVVGIHSRAPGSFNQARRIDKEVFEFIKKWKS